MLLVVQVKSNFNAVYQNDEVYLIPQCFIQLHFSLIYVKALILAFYLNHSIFILAISICTLLSYDDS